MIAAVPFLIMLGMVALVRLPDVFVWITAEDSLVEWSEFVMIFASSLIFAGLSLSLFRNHQVMLGCLSLLVAVGSLFVAGEEISWGQRVFGWNTPEGLAAMNVQRETTLHNISSVHPLFIYGMMLVGLYGTLMPFLESARWSIKRQSLLSYLLVPPLCLIPAFFMPFGYRFSRLVLGVDDRFSQLIFPITKFSEVTELCLYFGLAVFAWLNLRHYTGLGASDEARLIHENISEP